eukprot:TRINITY_DN19513_c0_g1_i1.p1 TRINITY_DN19513_c0_g1~~TRINITY_DN19513_c0_g1_i1.p1  ORF type:complete len:694 (+),score=193.99 TRINITY_DN19513_c0_g1_i1:145-2082(+)
MESRKMQVDLSKSLASLNANVPDTPTYRNVKSKLAAAAEECKRGNVQPHQPVVANIDDCLRQLGNLDSVRQQHTAAYEKFRNVFPSAAAAAAHIAPASPPAKPHTGQPAFHTIGKKNFNRMGTSTSGSQANDDDDADSTLSQSSSSLFNSSVQQPGDDAGEMYNDALEVKVEEDDDPDEKDGNSPSVPPEEGLNGDAKVDDGAPEAPQFDMMIPEENPDDYYPYDEEDRLDNIVYNDHPKYSNIKAATLEKLIEKMTSDSYVDHNLNLRYVFLLTYRSFTSAEEVLYKLSERFNIPTPLNITPSELELFEQGSVKKIKLKTLGLIQYWIKEFFSDFEDRPLLKSYLEDLLRQTFSRDPSYAKIATSLLELIHKQMQKAAKHKKMEARETKPRGVPKVFGDELDVVEVERKLLDRDPVDIAGQITLKDFEVLKKIPAREFLDQGWMKKNKKEICPRIMEMIDMYNRVSSWAQAFILSFDDESKRLQALRKVIYIARALRDLNNFSSLAAIYYGVVATPVHRLKCSKKLNKTEQAMVDEMAELFKNRQKGLQAVMETATNPCIPQLSLYLGHLTFMDSNEDMIGDLINFRKRSMIAERIRWIKQAQQAGYGGKIAPDPLLQQYIDSRVKTIHEDDLYKMSLAKEPQS